MLQNLLRCCYCCFFEAEPIILSLLSFKEEQKQKESKRLRLEYTGLGSSGCFNIFLIQHAIALIRFGRPRVPIIRAERIVDTLIQVHHFLGLSRVVAVRIDQVPETLL